MSIKSVEIVVKYDKGEPKTFAMRETSKAEKNKAGKVSKSIWQPEAGDKTVMEYGKIYIDTQAK